MTFKKGNKYGIKNKGKRIKYFPITKECEYCHKSWYAKKYDEIVHKKYCSKECSKKAIGTKNRKLQPIVKKYCKCGCGELIDSRNRNGEIYYKVGHHFKGKGKRKDDKKNPNKGDKCHFWKGGVTPLKIMIKRLYKYRQWRSDVFTRDNFICQGCNVRGGSLEPHHKKSYSLIIFDNKIKTTEQAENCEELWNINNGITLCHDCHKKTDNYGSKSKIKKGDQSW